MVVGLLNIKIVVRDSRSLKDKRQVIKSLKDKTRQRYNVSISEVGAQDNHKQCLLAVAMVGNEKRYVNSVLSTLVNSFRLFPGVELVDYELDFI
ncbi:MAG: hypothetical protein A3C38_05095 [Planctomycetes bacterium RIFCSPHIGHO2_02_FULL_50_42]|jgi:uncharacterized protein YlxP (DUF503 family)|uniref:DUF503 domain-containing protein n=1 Tax=Candidatus Avalokitesvara rifleensis TaxID=3367620 RepID=UPI0008D105F6|nr:DUF503 domain-containing protein [Candidatus Brocadiales bacterium]OHB39377.1 MAG: hypothetical protein A2060_06595 [Planctomycetes bacterium GWA2_50_13]OHB89321.1 MAG: hypothetical protein A3C38_05095 [Planctomycetes bacterium RIFCSPHIGHO2_02_FULL_50_42]OHB92005.1 MAG: hypothetical protein A3E75_04435 [Planctomycetes bacterium RIFCSPHIGHO2_12_FULL_51_37]OHB96119.1 MAG: hypothetical protein A3I59_01245 [Planctomycetes bacterium RIFCSPLOWO2_02_FULL_50_16]OHC03670.1 MAG: hypothetical protein 